MNSNQIDRITKYTDDLLAEAGVLKQTAHLGEFEHWVDHGGFFKWLSGCRHLFQMVGSNAKVWDTFFAADHVSKASAFEALNGSLQQFKIVLDAGLLCKVEDLVIADTFGNLLEQSSDLLQSGYVLAAGVLCRAVLEEHLRNLCHRYSCLPASGHTISHYKTALYAAKHLDKLAMQQVEFLATAGNHCAHNAQPPLPKDDVEKLIRDVTDFMIRNPLS